MSARRKYRVAPPLSTVSRTVRSHVNRGRQAKKGGKRTTTDRWRREVRPEILQSVVSATESLPWSRALLELLFEELYVDDKLEDVLRIRPRELQKRQYPQAIAVALVLRHSWQPEDLTWILERLGLRRPG